MHLLFLKLREFLMKLMSSLDISLKLAPFGMYCRIRRLGSLSKHALSFPGCVWMGNENNSIQCFSDFLMGGKLLPIFTSDRMNRWYVIAFFG